MLLMLLQFQQDRENKKARTVRFLSPASQKKVTQMAGKTFFYLIQTKYYFLFEMLPSP